MRKSFTAFLILIVVFFFLYIATNFGSIHGPSKDMEADKEYLYEKNFPQNIVDHFEPEQILSLVKKEATFKGSSLTEITTIPLDLIINESEIGPSPKIEFPEAYILFTVCEILKENNEFSKLILLNYAFPDEKAFSDSDTIISFTWYQNDYLNQSFFSCNYWGKQKEILELPVFTESISNLGWIVPTKELNLAVELLHGFASIGLSNEVPDDAKYVVNIFKDK